jgi:transposase
MGLYCGIDLHSTNNYLALLDEQRQTVLSQKLPNRLEAVLSCLEPWRAEIAAIAVESTFNWYWLVDGLMEAGYRVQLVNTSAVRRYEGLKYVDDRHDARWLAHLLQLGILPTGYIYPKEERPLRDLLRRRAFLVRQRTATLLSLKNVLSRQTGQQVPAKEIKRLRCEEIEQRFSDPFLALTLTSSLKIAEALKTQIARIEKTVHKQAKLRADFERLEAIPGIGLTLGLTIMYETGSIARFSDAGHFCSYSRCVPSQHLSNGKVKGKGNVKNGNPYLSWAFTEAAHFIIRYEPLAKRFYERKSTKTNPILALRAVAHKMARATFYVLRDQVPFQATQAFGSGHGA